MICIYDVDIGNDTPVARQSGHKGGWFFWTCRHQSFPRRAVEASKFGPPSHGCQGQRFGFQHRIASTAFLGKMPYEIRHLGEQDHQIHLHEINQHCVYIKWASEYLGISTALARRCINLSLLESTKLRNSAGVAMIRMKYY